MLGSEDTISEPPPPSLCLHANGFIGTLDFTRVGHKLLPMTGLGSTVAHTFTAFASKHFRNVKLQGGWLLMPVVNA
ncbi:hypothetical protein E6O75_ATG00683 [Venturia nashicola]|uniref:Uncharacterized protein n=1 Tax=Venturia nashicola TaxID=86259 RepID=A0A4Z1PH43_9PEZI|nr:hypothetical protein E6O75_ATG00683 [Venturia nashicola]